MLTSPCGPHQSAAAGAVLARAFHEQALSRYLLPEAEERAQALQSAFTGWVRSGRFVVDLWISEDVVVGVAVWSAPTSGGPPTVGGEPDDGVPREVQSWSTAAQERFGTYFRYVGALHARLIPAPHWYLALLGVDPAQQGRGYGSALLGARLAEARAAGCPCYLETGSARNVGLYERHGFEVLTTGIVPGTGVRVWALGCD